MKYPDFTVATYKSLLSSLQGQGYSFRSVADFIRNPENNSVVLRHDVDSLPGNSLRLARLEFSMGILGSYYFRAVPGSWDEAIIREVAGLGHEIGYHYENLATCNGNLDKAFTDFEINLAKLRMLAPVCSICMHGSPMSRWDSRDLWKAFDYKKLGIVGEPYFDIDFTKTFYLTDTGRRWDGWKVSVRDKITQQEEWVRRGLVFHSTWDIIRAADREALPDRIMITAHPQRWHDKPFPWLREFICQNLKNGAKYFLIRTHTS